MYNCYNELIKVIIMQIFVKRKILSIEIILNLSKQASARTHTHTHTHTHTEEGIDTAVKNKSSKAMERHAMSSQEVE